MNYFVVKYSGPFGFIKPWTAVRDGETFSQQFLTHSILEGMEKKLFPELLEEVTRTEKIKRYRLNYAGIDVQQERTWSKGGFEATKEKGIYKTNVAILKRGVMLQPHLYLAFASAADAGRAACQSICLSRNEDILLPFQTNEMSEWDFDEIPGFELLPADENSGFKVGYNRFHQSEPMYGQLKIFGNPIRVNENIK